MVNPVEREPIRTDTESGDERPDNRRELIECAKNSENQEEKNSAKIKIAEKAVKEYEDIKKEERKIEKKIEKLEEKKEEDPSDDVKKSLEKAKRKKKQISWRVSVLEKEETLMEVLDDKAEDEVKKKLGEELLRKEETIRREKEKLDEEVNRERNISGLTGAERDKWIEKINRLEKKQLRLVRELGKDEFLTLFEFEKREKEQTRKETVEDLKKEGAEYKAMKDEKGRFFTGQRLEVTEDQFKKARKEMATATGERGKKIKKALLSIFTSIGYFFGGLVEILWEGVKFWAGAGSKGKEKK